MTDLTEYFRSYIETLPYRFFCMVQMYIRQILGGKTDQQKKNTGRRRSLVRRISNWIPVMPRKKIYIKVNSSIESSNSSNSSNPHRTLTQIKASDGLNSIRTIFESTPNSGICWRSAVSVTQRKNVCITNREEKMTNMQPKEFSLQSESYNCTFAVPGPRASTPLSFLDNATMSSNTDCAMAKITQLEEELALLRQQIASIAAMQGNSNIQSQPKSGTLPQSSLPLPPPPPPPPPPPVPPSLQPLSVGDLMPLKDGIQQSKLKKTTYVKLEGETNTGSQTKGREILLPHMSDVLKVMHKVKLRPIERSPGGTPIRRPALPSASQDPVSLLTAALKRRFARIHPQEISPEKENQQSFDSPSSIENGSPFSIRSKPFGQHLLKPVNNNVKLRAPFAQNQFVT